MSEHIKTITDASFDADVINSSKARISGFLGGMVWTMPCTFSHTEEVAAIHGNEVTFAKINIDENPHAASKFGVMSIPTLIIFKNGQVEAVKMGLLSKSELNAFVESNV